MTDTEYIEKHRIKDNLFSTLKAAFLASFNCSSLTFYHDKDQEWAFLNGDRVSIYIHTNHGIPKRHKLLSSK